MKPEALLSFWLCELLMGQSEWEQENDMQLREYEIRGIFIELVHDCLYTIHTQSANKTSKNTPR